MARCTGVADRTIHDHIRTNADKVRAAIAPLTLDDDLRNTILRYLDGLDATSMGGVGCVCGILSGSPSRYGRRIKRVSNRDFAGHSESVYQCVACGRMHSVTTDPGYHVPQYHWG